MRRLKGFWRRLAGRRARAAAGLFLAGCLSVGAIATAVDRPPQRAAAVRFTGERSPTRSPLRALASWCGAGAETSANRPDTSLSSPNLIHVTYAVPADGVDRFASSADAIKTDVDAIGAWWTSQDASRAPRFDLAVFSGCADVDLSVVRLPKSGASYLDAAHRVFDLAADLAALAPSTTKSLVYYDGPVAPVMHFICGTSIGLSPQTGGVPSGFTFVWLRSDCPNDLGQGGLTAVVATHETAHSLGAVLPGAPHGCPNDAGHVCDSRLDLMYPKVFADSRLSSSILDIGRDDYYGFAAAQRGGSAFDVQTSAWLARLPRFQLSVRHNGNGSVDITGPGGSLSCSSDCAVALENGTNVTLTANPAADSKLTGWQGACAGTQKTCHVTSDAAKEVTAAFGPRDFALAVTVTGKGKVTSSPSGISCPRLCRASFTAPTLLRARAASGYRFTGWSGACAGRTSCTIAPGADRSVRATFRRRAL
jgi:hypothetical protein